MESRRELEIGFGECGNTPQRSCSPSIMEKSNGTCTPITKLCCSLASAVICEKLLVENTSDSGGPITPRRNPRRSCAKESPNVNKQTPCRPVQSSRKSFGKPLPQNTTNIVNSYSREFSNLKSIRETQGVAICKNDVSLKLNNSSVLPTGNSTLENNRDSNVSTDVCHMRVFVSQTPEYKRDQRQETDTPICGEYSSCISSDTLRTNIEPVICSTPINSRSSVKDTLRTNIEPVICSTPINSRSSVKDTVRTNIEPVICSTPINSSSPVKDILRPNIEPVNCSTPINSSSSVKAKRRAIGAPKPRPARKSCARQKLNVSEYDPEYDIFMDNEMFVQYDIESLKCEIGKLLNTSDLHTFKARPLLRSSSCGENLNYVSSDDEAIVGETEALPALPKSLKTNTKKVHKNKKLQKASSVPDLRESKGVEKRTKITSEKTLWALQDARLTIMRMAQRSKNYLTFKKQKLEEKGQAGSGNPSESSTHTASKQNQVCVNENTASINPNNESEDVYWCPTQPVASLILSDVVAYVEVVSGNEDRSLGVKHQLKELGATVVDNFTKDVPVTHVIFNDGLVSTYKKAIKRKVPLVSVLWINECKRAGTRVSERLYLPQNVDQYKCPDAVKKLKKRKIIHPYSKKSESPSGRQLRQKPGSGKHDAAEKTKLPVSGMEKPGQGSKSAANESGTVDFLATIAGIGPGEVQVDNSTNSAIPDNEFATPLAVRLLRKIIPSKEEKYPTSSSAAKDNLNMECDITRSESSVMKENFVDQDRSDSRMRRKRKLFSPRDDKIEDIDVVDADIRPIENPYMDTSLKKKQRNGFRKDGRMNGVASCHKAKNVTAHSSEKCSKEVPETSGKQRWGVTITDNNVNNFPCVRRSRRSSLDFITIKREGTPVDGRYTPGIVCTLLPPVELDVVMSVVDKLGVYVVEKNVTSCTTHIVTSSAKRTLKLLKGMARGCWIVSQDWVLKSLEEGKWLDEEEFEMTSFSPAMQKLRLEKVEFGTMFRPDIFSACGPIFISPKCRAPRADVAELITLCGGHVISKISRANLLVGAPHSEPTGVDVCWVFDSITSYSCRPIESYIL